MIIKLFQKLVKPQYLKVCEYNEYMYEGQVDEQGLACGNGIIHREAGYHIGTYRDNYP